MGLRGVHSGTRPAAFVLGMCALLVVGGVSATASPAEPAPTAGSGTGASNTADLPALTALTGFGAPAVAATPAGTAPAATAPAAAAPGAAVAAPGAAAVTIPTQPYKNCTDTTGVPYATGLPPLPCLLFKSGIPGKSPTVWSDNGALFDNIVQQVNRAKLKVALPKSLSRIFTLLCTAPDGPRPCPDSFGFVYPPVGSPYRAGFFGTVGYAFLQSPLGDSPQYGVVTRKNFGLYGFGAIPGTATLTVSQPTVGGVVDPLVLAYPSFTRLFPKGTVVEGYEKFGPCCGTLPDGTEAPGPAQLAGDLSISGPITITVSDVKLDGVPLDVGSTCQAKTTLSLTAKGGWVNGPPVDFYPGEYQPFLPPSYVHAGLPGVDPDPQHPLPTFPDSYHYTGVDVPAFSGCIGRTGEDVSALITGLASGPGNRLDLSQLTRFTGYGCLTQKVADGVCLAKHPAVVDPDKVYVPPPTPTPAAR